MDNQITNTGTKAVSQFLNQKNVLEKFSELLGTKAQGFIASVISAVNSNDLLKNATNESIYASALMAATLDLPVNANLGLAYFIPFNNKKLNKQECQFQIGYKGFIQLSMRSGQFKTISATPIFENQLINENPLTGFEFDFTKKSENVIGFAAYFKLLNGFEKTLYMTVDELKKHGGTYSQTFKKGFGLWNDNFEAMALKTVLKLLLSKFAPLSIEMQKAQIADQGIIRNVDTMEVEYVDNPDETLKGKLLDRKNEIQRGLSHLEKCNNLEEIEMFQESIFATDLEAELKEEIAIKIDSLTKNNTNEIAK
jgi:recombination protein RecT